MVAFDRHAMDVELAFDVVDAAAAAAAVEADDDSMRPRGAVAVEGGLVAGGSVDAEVELGGVTSCLGGEFLESLPALRDRFGSFDRHPAVAVPDDIAQGAVVPDGAEQEWRSRLLDRFGIRPARPELDSFPVVRGFVISPQCPDGLDVLAESRFAVGPGNAVGSEQSRTGMWVCSVTNIDSKPRSSAATATSAGVAVWSVKCIITPMCIASFMVGSKLDRRVAVDGRTARPQRSGHHRPGTEGSDRESRVRRRSQTPLARRSHRARRGRRRRQH